MGANKKEQNNEKESYELNYFSPILFYVFYL